LQTERPFFSDLAKARALRFHPINARGRTCNTIEVGESMLRASSKIEACDQVDQTLIGAIRDRHRQRLLVKRFDIAADEESQQPAQRLLLGYAPAQKSRAFAGSPEGPQGVVLLRKSRMQVVHVSLFE
jgi:hypothetical protein